MPQIAQQDYIYIPLVEEGEEFYLNDSDVEKVGDLVKSGLIADILFYYQYEDGPLLTMRPIFWTINEDSTFFITCFNMNKIVELDYL